MPEKDINLDIPEKDTQEEVYTSSNIGDYEEYEGDGGDPELMESEFDPEELEDEEGIFPDGSGPSDAMIVYWREKYKEIYYTEVDDGEYYIWRTLTRPELKALSLMDDEDSLHKEDVISEKCVLWPTNYTSATSKAGIPTVLAEQIFEKSGFVTRTGPIAL